MQQDVDTVTANVRPIEILGVNLIGAEGGNTDMCTGRTLAWLQDTPAAKVWDAWHVAYRDVVVLDAHNKVITVYNLTQYDLANPANYSALKAILLHAAQTPAAAGAP